MKKVYFDGESFLIPETEDAKEKLIGWYRKEAARVLKNRVAEIAERMGVQPCGVKITSAKTRWGSCSYQNHLNFSWRLLKPKLLLKKTEKLIKDYLHYGGDGLLLSDVGDELYSDYGEKYSSRNDTAELQIKQLDYVKQKAKNVWIDGASAYLTSHVNGIVNAPCESSHYDIQSFELPLFSLIFHGVLPITYTPVNTDESIIQVRMLKCLETGTVPYFRLTADSPQIYADTKLEFLLNTSFKRWQEKCTDFCKTYTSVCGGLTDEVIVGYEIIGDVRKVTYSDGSTVYANYASTQQTINDITIDALSIEKR